MKSSRDFYIKQYQKAKDIPKTSLNVAEVVGYFLTLYGDKALKAVPYDKDVIPYISMRVRARVETILTAVLRGE